MKKVIELTKVLLKNTNNQFTMQNKSKASKRGVLILVIYVAIIFGYLSYNIVDMLIQINQPVIFLGMLLIAISALVIFQTIVTSINMFYMSRDIEYLLPMPITPKELLMAKFNTLLITEYVMELLFTIVPIIIYGMLTNAGLIFYIYAIFVLLLFPILPAAIASLIIVFIMSFSKKTKNKDKYAVVATIISIIFVIGIQFIAMPEVEMTEEQLVQNFVKLNGMIDVVGKYFITIKPSLEALANYSNLFGGVSILKLG